MNKCLLNTCEDQVVVGKELEHATTVHGLPNCPCGETIVSNYVRFLQHVNSHTNVKCPGCDDVMSDWMLREHAVTRHGFPACSVCGAIVDSNVENFFRHTAAHTGETTKYDCAECRLEFPSRRALTAHNCLPFDVEIVPVQEYLQRIHGQWQVVHLEGMRLLLRFNLVLYNKWLTPLTVLPRTTATSFGESNQERSHREHLHGKYRLSEDSHVYIEHVSTSPTVPWLYRFMGVPRELGRGSLMPDLKLALVHNFKTRPSRHIRLFLLNRFYKYATRGVEMNTVTALLASETLPAATRDIPEFCRTIEAAAESILHAVVYVCDNPRLTSRPVREELRSMERARRKRTSLAASNLPVGNVLDLVVGGVTDDAETRVAKRARFERGKINQRGDPVDASAVNTQRVSNKRLLESDTAAFETTEEVSPMDVNMKKLVLRNIERFLSDRESLHGAAAARNDDNDDDNDDDDNDDDDNDDDNDDDDNDDDDNDDDDNGDDNADDNADDNDDDNDVDNDEEWDDRFWRTIYIIYRDYVLYFVNSGKMERLQLFSNFFNEEPTAKDLEDLLYGFAQFIAEDRNGGDAGVAERAKALQRGIAREAIFFRELHQLETIREDLTTDQRQELSRQIWRVKSLRLHRWRLTH